MSGPRRTGTPSRASAKPPRREPPLPPESVGAPTAGGRPRTTRPKDLQRPPESVGSPTAGRLVGGAELQAGPHLRLARPGETHWGLPPLVRLLERAARRVAARFEGATLLVGDLSRPKGGNLGGHRSHTSGRDADVGFYFVDAEGRSATLGRYHHVRPDGSVEGAPELRFDDARNWTLVEAWVTDPRARVQHIFVSAPLRARLLSHARRVGAYLPVRQRAALAMKQPRHALPHDNHFHVRIACPSGGEGRCVGEPTPRRAARRDDVRGAPAPRRGGSRRAPPRAHEVTPGR